MESEVLPRIYTDGACKRNPGPGGWAVCYRDAQGEMVELGGGEPETTNNRMEMRAALEALRLLAGRPGCVVTDSEYLRKGVTSWVHSWKRNGWMTAAREPVKNRDLWIELDALNGPQVRWEWVKGHAGDPLNERCDEIAQAFSRGEADPFARQVTPRRSAAPTTKPRTAAATPRTKPAPRPRVARPVPVQGDRLPPTTTRYLSYVDGALFRHASWPECEARVKGARGARYRKCANATVEQEVLLSWGLTAE